MGYCSPSLVLGSLGNRFRDLNRQAGAGKPPADGKSAGNGIQFQEIGL